MNPNFFNLSHRKKKDILSELLTQNTFEGMISKQELNALIKAIGEASHGGLERKNDPQKKRKISDRKKEKPGRKKTTYYLSEEVSKNLEIVTKEIRSFLPENIQPRITKSRVVDKALTLMLKEFTVRGKKSKLAHSVLHFK